MHFERNVITLLEVVDDDDDEAQGIAHRIVSKPRCVNPYATKQDHGRFYGTFLKKRDVVTDFSFP